MRRHKFLGKIYKLLERIERWKQVGPAVAEKDWDAADDAIKDVTELERLCRANDQYKIPQYRMKKCNEYWHQYESKNLVWTTFLK
jgi:hypothetical protein